MKFLLIAFTFVVCYIPGFAQNDYVVTTGQDTLYGKITILMASNYAEEIIIKNNGKQTLNTSQFISFVHDGATYKPIYYSNRSRIMQLVHPGKYATLYLFRSEGSYGFGTELLYKNDSREGKELPSLGFKKTVVKFLEDCPEIGKITDDKMFKRTSINQLLDFYNNCRATAGNIPSAPGTSPAPTPVPVPPAKAPVVETNQKPVLLILNSLKAKVPDQSKNGELLTLIDDISKKVTSNEKVPGYMTEALKTLTKGMDGVQEDVEAIVMLLSK